MTTLLILALSGMIAMQIAVFVRRGRERGAERAMRRRRVLTCVVEANAHREVAVGCISYSVSDTGTNEYVEILVEVSH